MSNVKVILVTLCIIVLAILAMTIYKIGIIEHDRVYEVIHKRIIEGAISCVNEDKCTNTMTLGELIQKGYLKEQVDPDTKMYYAKDSKIEYVLDHYEFSPSY